MNPGTLFEKAFRNLFVQDTNGRELIITSSGIPGSGDVKRGRYASGRMIFEIIQTDRCGADCKIVDVQSGSDPHFKVGEFYYFYNGELEKLIKPARSRRDAKN